MAAIDGTGGLKNLGQTYGTGSGGTLDKGSSVGGGVSSQDGVVPPGGGGTGNAALDQALNTLFPLPRNSSDTLNRLETTQNAPTVQEYEEALKTLLAAVRDPDMLAKLMVEMSSMSRQNALDARLAARSQARSELKGPAAETRESAQKMLISAVVGVALAVVGAVVAFSGAAKSMAATKSSASHTQDAMQANKIMDNAGDGLSDAGKLKLTHQASGSEALAKMSQAKADSLNMLTNAIGGLINAFKGMTEGTVSSEAKKDEAQGMELAAAAQDSQAFADMAKQFTDELQEMIRSAIQFLKDMHQVETDMMATASRL